ncbi:MAG: class I SAM-dependent methyltransferase [Cyclobacteriaceae bacterium]|nr:class I SAM-dependent methyltransferase [Cyclobacteriaceae bacterium]
MGKIESEVSSYYSKKIREHGPVPAGVDWNSEGSQQLRFEQLLKIVEPESDAFSLLDFGCGYGSLLNYMKERYESFTYQGYDISMPMIEEAKKSLGDTGWHTSLETLITQTYVVASGVFNVRQGIDDKEWRQYIADTLTQLDSLAIKGFAFNMLTSYSDKEKMRDYLFYSDPGEWFRFCKLNFSRNVALLHDYDLYEYTILVRK